ncbi:MBL fold metallo-hydrolase [Blastococcus tunisiensis]|uniref:Glyoxylase, beta-lactamase superfamily II n=1 Tax=Blastococcus tunisiensis TaxID=1798228 RepID=A0A1I2A4U8_9ACTN|nr:MBL fold metallo-hydrolase [Blastococcus sp. DSM 46838]SFE38827.1 Glyoxylase, beta-lactamase superfamily II [Blastococcus sp. DSM 46838]
MHRIPLPLPDDGLRAVNVYVVDGDDGPVLIDSGWAIAAAREQLEMGLRQLGYQLGDARRFLVTHAHRDHYEQAIFLRREFGTAISLGSGEQPALDVLQAGKRHPFEPQLQLLSMMGADSLVDELTAAVAFVQPDPENWQSPDTWLAADDVAVAGRRALSVVPTPGHTAGHVVFHDAADALLFTGDHVLPTITPSVGFEPVLSPTALSDFLGSLARVRQLPDALMLPAHGPVSPSVHARVDELLEHHDIRLAEVLAFVRGGAHTGLEVAKAIRWTRRELSLSDLNAFNQLLALAETAVHLDLLQAQGRVTFATDGEVRLYQAS